MRINQEFISGPRDSQASACTQGLFSLSSLSTVSHSPYTAYNHMHYVASMPVQNHYVPCHKKSDSRPHINIVCHSFPKSCIAFRSTTYRDGTANGTNRNQTREQPYMTSYQIQNLIGFNLRFILVMEVIIGPGASKKYTLEYTRRCKQDGLHKVGAGPSTISHVRELPFGLRKRVQVNYYLR